MLTTKRIACPKCKEEGRDSRNNHLKPWDDGSGGWCFHGHGAVRFEGEVSITTANMRVNEQALDVGYVSTFPIREIPSRRISLETCQRYEVRTEVDPVDASSVSVFYPFFNGQSISAYKRRYLPKTFSVIGKIRGLFGQKQCKQNARLLIIVEGEQDVLAGWEMLRQRGKDWNIVSLPHGANEEGTIDATTLKEIEWIVKHEKVLLMLDNDGPGRATAKTLAELLASQTTVGISTFPSTIKDTSDCWENDLVDEWYKAMSNVIIYRPESIVEGKDVSLEELKKPKSPGIPLPYPILQKQTWGLRKGEITLLTAGTGIGKSTFTRELGYHLISSGYTVAFIALETQMEDVTRSLIAMDNDVPPHKLMFDPSTISDEAYERSFNWMVKSNQTHYFKHWGSIDCDVLKSKMMYFAKALKVDFIILDHVSMVIAGNDTYDERKDIDMLFAAMTNIVNETGVGIIPIIHLKRVNGKSFNKGDEVELTDLRGSAGAEQMSFNVWALERNQQGDRKDIVKLRNLKNRAIGFTGLADTLRYNHETGRLELYTAEEFECA